MTEEQQYIVNYLKRLASIKASHRCYYVEQATIDNSCEFLASLRDCNIERLDERTIIFTAYNMIKLMFYNKNGHVEFKISKDEIKCSRKSFS